MAAPGVHERVHAAAARRENVEVPFSWIGERTRWTVGEVVVVDGVTGIVWLVDADEQCLGIDFGRDSVHSNRPVAWRHPDIDARRKAWTDARWWDAEHSCWRLKGAS